MEICPKNNETDYTSLHGKVYKSAPTPINYILIYTSKTSSLLLHVHTTLSTSTPTLSAFFLPIYLHLQIYSTQYL